MSPSCRLSSWLTRRRCLSCAVLAIAVAAAAACRDSVGVELDDFFAVSRDGSKAFQTDSLELSLESTSGGYRGSIRFVFTNPTRDTVYLLHCKDYTPVRLEKYENGRWILGYLPTIFGCLSPSVVIAPATQYRGLIYIFAGLPGNNIYPKFEVSEIRGIYRLVFNHFVQSWNEQKQTWGPPIAAEHLISNHFLLSIGRP